MATKRTTAGLRACIVRGCKNPTATSRSLRCLLHQEKS